MKNQFTSRIVKLTFAFMFVLIASSCSQDDESMDAAVLAKEINSEIAAKGAKMSIAAVETFTVPNEVCAGDATDFCFEAPIGTNLQVQQWIAGDWVQVYQISKSTSVNTCFQLTFANAGAYQLRYKIGSGGFTEVPVTVVNCGGCEESFNYVSNGGGSYTFTYIPAEDMTDAELVFTFAQGSYVSGLVGWSTLGVTMQKTMNLTACIAYTWTVLLTPNCNGNSSQSNLWTDFKVNNVSKKNTLTNIVASCN
ncbi:MAG: hypothetical protein GZ086_06870 [Gelidibacter sp.]|nr:hypothetical protein [Gelidibacter sp.]